MARIGVALLNVLSPGLGLLRLQRLRIALAFLSAPYLLLALLVAVLAAAPTLAFPAWAALTGGVLVALLGIYLVAIAITWRTSRLIEPTKPWWTRWYALAGVVAVGVAISAIVPDFTQFTYKSFYIPSEAMEPTLLVDDRLVAAMHGPETLRRGDIIIFTVGASAYIKRVAALPGDRIEMRAGHVVLNGQPITQRYLRTDHVSPEIYGSEARRLAEQFPGEARPHEIYDMGMSAGDDMAEQRIAPGHVFVLGDNRDNSADSRFPRSEFGVEQLRIADIRGHALFRLWGPSRKLGESLRQPSE